MQNNKTKPEIKNEDIIILDFSTLGDNSAIIDFDYKGANYLQAIPMEDVAQCARLNLWTTKYDSEGEDYEISLDGFMESDFEPKHAIELAAFYLKETNN